MIRFRKLLRRHDQCGAWFLLGVSVGVRHRGIEVDRIACIEFVGHAANHDLQFARQRVQKLHPGVEFLHTLTGKLEIVIGGMPYELDAGDSIYFDSSVPHTYRNAQKKPCSALVVTTE